MITSNPLRERDLERQCRLFSRYLVDREPTEYVIAQYLRAHRIHPDLVNVRLDLFDRTLLRVGSSSRLTMSMSDAYARILAPRSMLRKKLILLLALLENSPGTFEAFDTPTASNTLTAYISLGSRCARFAGLLALSCIFLLPLQLALTATRARQHG